ncbi:unnamed protein product, partial [Thelazia callipaeda]|uniref:Ig-like domain-containing protein n=1 Tax=Thelazia callipaeda TaxID=103827 RepID=A0A0N5D1Z2_THECL
EPNVGDGGAYKCTASNQFGESNANINLNFAGSFIFVNTLGGEEEEKEIAKGPTFLGKPRIIPKNDGALIVMECRVKSASKPHGTWYKNGVQIHESPLYNMFFAELEDSTYLLQLKLHNPVAEDAGQYRCNIKNDQGETNANLTLNFEQEIEEQEKLDKKDSASSQPGSRQGSRPGSPKKQLRSREGTPKKTLKSRESTPKKLSRSGTSTPTQEVETTAGDATTKVSGIKSEQMEIDGTSTKRKSKTALPPTEKKSRQKSPRYKSKSPRLETPPQINEEKSNAKIDENLTHAIPTTKADENLIIDKENKSLSADTNELVITSASNEAQETLRKKSDAQKFLHTSLEEDMKNKDKIEARRKKKLKTETEESISEPREEKSKKSPLISKINQAKENGVDNTKTSTKSKDRAPVVIENAKSKVSNTLQIFTLIPFVKYFSKNY